MRYATDRLTPGYGSLVKAGAWENRPPGSLFRRDFSDGEPDDWTVVEDTSPNVTVRKGYDKLSIFHPGGDGTAELHGIVWPCAPAGDFYLDVGWSGAIPSGNFYHVGAVAADGATYGAGNQALLLYHLADGGFTRWDASGWDSRDSHELMYQINRSQALDILHFRLAFASATNGWTFYASPDAVSWITLGTQTQAFTTTHVGAALTSWSNAADAVVTVEYVAVWDGTP